MSAQENTPEPWVVEEGAYDLLIVGDDGDHESRRVVAVVHSKLVAEQQANARLMAAAPALLAALRAVLHASAHAPRDLHETIRKSRSAVARATAQE